MTSPIQHAGNAESLNTEREREKKRARRYVEVKDEQEEGDGRGSLDQHNALLLADRDSTIGRLSGTCACACVGVGVGVGVRSTGRC